jgi:hypothetical protein
MDYAYLSYEKLAALRQLLEELVQQEGMERDEQALLNAVKKEMETRRFRLIVSPRTISQDSALASTTRRRSTMHRPRRSARTATPARAIERHGGLQLPGRLATSQGRANGSY